MPRLRDVAATLSMIGIIVGNALETLTAWPGARPLIAGALLAYLACEFGRSARGARIICGACVVLCLGLWITRADAGRIIGGALVGAADLSAFFAALGFLHVAAKTSPLIAECGAVMVRQPPGRRYLVLTLGAHLISLVLNFGVLSLLGVMVTKGNTLEAAGFEQRIVDIRKARMMSALLRGFVAMVMWSPLSVSFAVIHAVIGGVSWNQLIALQIGLAMAVTAIGWVTDRLSFPATLIAAAVSTDSGSSDSSVTPLLRLGLFIGCLMVAILGVSQGLHAPPILGIILIIPLSAYGWLLAQNADLGLEAPYQAFKDLALRVSLGLPESRNEVLYIGGAMFLGLTASKTLDHAILSHWLIELSLPPLVLCVLLPWSVMALAQLGVPQIFSVTMLGGALPDLGPLGISPMVMASGLMGAWALSAATAPVGAAVLTVAREAKVPARVVTRQWNGGFVLASGLFLGLWVVGVSWGVTWLGG